MAICLELVGGALTPTATPTHQCDMVALSGQEYAAYAKPNMTLQEVMQLSAAVVLAWAVAWGFKLIKRGIHI